MDIANSRSLGFAGKEICFRKIEFERYRKPHVVEYPHSAIVLNPQHTRQLKDSFHSRHRNDHAHGEEGSSDSDEHRGTTSNTDNDDDDDDDPSRMDKFMQLCSDAQFRNSLHLRWQHIAPVGLGLVNLGNTCFANSVLQALAHVPALAQYFMNTFRSADNQLGAPFDFAFALAETFRKMHHAAQPGGRGNNSTTGAYRPGQIMGNLRLLSKHFSIGRQSDAHEFAVQLLFACQKSLLHRLMGSKKVQPRVAHTTALYRICGGYLLSQVTWSRQEEIQQLLRAGKQQEAIDLKMEAKQARQPNHASRRASRYGLDTQTMYSNTYDPFTILSVEVAGHTLMHCLDKFCLAEELDGRCYHSPREVGVRAKKKFSIHVPPPVLMIHLKRFSPTGNKINKHVHFPLELNITRYCTPSHSTAAQPEEKEVREDCQYELNAICVHDGSSLNYGHYYTMAKASNGMWYEFNDSHVSRLSEEQLQRAQAYMLCYSRILLKNKTKSTAQDGRSSANKNSNAAAALPHSSGLPAVFVKGEAALTAAPIEENNVALGKELSDAEVQALLEKRWNASQPTTKPGAAGEAVPKKKGNLSSEGDDDEEWNGGASQPTADRGGTLKRLREELQTDSDSEEEERQRLRRPPAARQSNHENTNSRLTSTPHEEHIEQESGEGGASPEFRSAANTSTAKFLTYGSLIKSMRHTVHGNGGATSSAGSDLKTSGASTHPNFRVGRHAVSALHARKVHDTPDTVKRPATAPKFQQRIRDPMWEMAMDRGKVKKVKSKEKAPDPFEGTNPFQEVSRGMFDVRGRRRRE